MPHAFILDLVSEREGAPQPLQPHQAAHGLFYHLLSLISPDLSATVHDARRVPFTLAVRPGRGGMRLRITLLNDDLFAPLLSVLLTRAPRWRLGTEDYQIGRLLATPEGHPRAGCVSWADIAAAPPRSSLALEFLTPTVFATSLRNGKRRYTPIPETRLVLGGLLRSYQAFAPQPFENADLLAEALTDRVSITRLSVQTEEHRAGRHDYVGFVGKVMWQVQEDDAELRRVLGRLAALAPYTGVGTKTPYGMGQVALL